MSFTVEIISRLIYRSDIYCWLSECSLLFTWGCSSSGIAGVVPIPKRTWQVRFTTWPTVKPVDREHPGSSENKIPECLVISFHAMGHILPPHFYFTSRNSIDTNHCHCCDVIMGTMASQTTSLTIVYSTVYSGADQRKRQSSASLAFVRGIHRLPVNSPHTNSQ